MRPAADDGPSGACPPPIPPWGRQAMSNLVGRMAGVVGRGGGLAM